MKTKKLALYTGIAAIVIGAGATTLALQADESAQPSGALAQSGEAGQAITIYKSPNCGCCQSWAEHLATNGFDTRIVETDNLNEIKQQHGVPRDMASCHTALIGNLVIEGRFKDLSFRETTCNGCDNCAWFADLSAFRLPKR